MRKLSLPALLCLTTLTTLTACAVHPTVPPGDPPTPTVAAAATAADEQAILQLEQAWCEAFRTGNAEALAGIEDDGYTLTNSHAEVSSKADDIAEVKARAIEYSKFYNHEQQVHIYGDTAVVNGITSLEGVSGDKAFKLDVRFTDVFVRRNGEWKAVAGHVTRLEG